jgi:hypothetical protein
MPSAWPPGYWRERRALSETTMRAPGKKSELIASLEQFQVGSGRLPGTGEMGRLNDLIAGLARENPTPILKTGIGRLAGMWKCIFTNSHFVLGLNKLPMVNLSAVYQNVVVHADCTSGHYINIAELSRGAAVRTACGEYAEIHTSATEPGRIDVQYQWFYFAIRVLSPYEGHRSLCNRLELGCLPRHIRVPFQKPGWQTILYLDDDLRVVCGNNGGIFVLVKEAA